MFNGCSGVPVDPVGWGPHQGPYVVPDSDSHTPSSNPSPDGEEKYYPSFPTPSTLLSFSFLFPYGRLNENLWMHPLSIHSLFPSLSFSLLAERVLVVRSPLDILRQLAFALSAPAFDDKISAAFFSFYDSNIR